MICIITARQPSKLTHLCSVIPIKTKMSLGNKVKQESINVNKF